MSGDSPSLDRIRRALTEPSDGAVGIVHELLAIARETDIHIDWHEGNCRVHLAANRPVDRIEVPLPKAVFRAALARIAAIRVELESVTFSPYGGQGPIVFDPQSARHVFARFINTADQQCLAIGFGVALDVPFEAPGRATDAWTPPQFVVNFLIVGQVLLFVCALLALLGAALWLIILVAWTLPVRTFATRFGAFLEALRRGEPTGVLGAIVLGWIVLWGLLARIFLKPRVQSIDFTSLQHSQTCCNSGATNSTKMQKNAPFACV